MTRPPKHTIGTACRSQPILTGTRWHFLKHALITQFAQEQFALGPGIFGIYVVHFVKTTNPAYPSYNIWVQRQRIPLPPTNKYLLKVYCCLRSLLYSQHSSQRNPCKCKSDLVSLLFKTHLLPSPKFSQTKDLSVATGPCAIQLPVMILISSLTSHPLCSRHIDLLAIPQDIKHTPTSSFLSWLFPPLEHTYLRKQSAYLTLFLTLGIWPNATFQWAFREPCSQLQPLPPVTYYSFWFVFS